MFSLSLVDALLSITPLALNSYFEYQHEARYLPKLIQTGTKKPFHPIIKCKASLDTQTEVPKRFSLGVTDILGTDIERFLMKWFKLLTPSRNAIASSL